MDFSLSRPAAERLSRPVAFSFGQRGWHATGMVAMSASLGCGSSRGVVDVVRPEAGSGSYTPRSRSGVFGSAAFSCSDSRLAAGTVRVARPAVEFVFRPAGLLPGSLVPGAPLAGLTFDPPLVVSVVAINCVSGACHEFVARL